MEYKKYKRGMNPNSHKNIKKYSFKKGHKKPENAYSFPIGHKTNVGKKYHTEEWKEKLRQKMKGNKYAVGSKGNTGQHWTVKDKTKFFGHVPWNKGVPWSVETKKKIGNSNKNKIRSQEFKDNLKIRNKKLDIKPPVRIGNKNNRWKGGITPENTKIRHSLDYKTWLKRCMERDFFTCQISKKKGGKLVVHHIKNFSEFPELRFNINNGITLSNEIHVEFHKRYGRNKNNEEQLKEFLKQKENEIANERDR